MNFLQFLASGPSILNFNLQSKDNKDKIITPILTEKQEGFHKIDSNSVENKQVQAINLNMQGQTALLNKLLQNERQDIINRYLQLNIQLLEKKLTKGEKSDNRIEIVQNQPLQHQDSQQKSINQKVCNNKKKIKKVNCGHNDKSHYAKGMCSNCYHKYGRTKKPWNCSHDKLYAGGMCQNCYINQYNRKRREQGFQIQKGQILAQNQQKQQKQQ